MCQILQFRCVWDQLIFADLAHLFLWIFIMPGHESDYRATNIAIFRIALPFEYIFNIYTMFVCDWTMKLYNVWGKVKPHVSEVIIYTLELCIFFRGSLLPLRLVWLPTFLEYSPERWHLTHINMSIPTAAHMEINIFMSVCTSYKTIHIQTHLLIASADK